MTIVIIAVIGFVGLQPRAGAVRHVERAGRIGQVSFVHSPGASRCRWSLFVALMVAWKLGWIQAARKLTAACRSIPRTAGPAADRRRRRAPLVSSSMKDGG